MRDDCIDCALFECDICEQQDPGYGCCCGRVAPTRDYDDDARWDEAPTPPADAARTATTQGPA